MKKGRLISRWCWPIVSWMFGAIEWATRARGSPVPLRTCSSAKGAAFTASPPEDGIRRGEPRAAPQDSGHPKKSASAESATHFRHGLVEDAERSAGLKPPKPFGVA
jgi:hypothetical protein